MGARYLGPNVKRLLAHFVAREAIPPGGGMVAGIEAIQHLGELTRIGLRKMDQAIEAVRAAPDNPYRDDEETIAGAILAELDKPQSDR